MNIAVAVLLFASLISCKDAGTNPTPVIKTPRQMTWTADTLRSPDPTSIQLMMRNILVFSPNDVWICGWSDVARGLIWHYDGKQWSESNIGADVGGMRVDDIAGYSSNDLWAGGYSGNNIFLAHYNGYKWTRESDMNIRGELLDMSMDPNGNIWACGRNGMVLKFDKTKWTANTIKVNHYSDAEYFLQSVAYYKDKMHLIGIVSDAKRMKNVYYYITGDMDSWIITDSVVSDSPSSKIKWGDWNLNATNFGKFYSVGLEGIWAYSPNGWNQVYKIDSSIYGVSGISENYILAVGDFQQVLFFNGNTWENFVNLFPQINRNFVCMNVWTNGYETFIIGYGNVGGYLGTIIFHGK